MSEVDQALALLSRGTHEILVEDELKRAGFRPQTAYQSGF